MNALKRAAEILREDAESIRQSHTLGGDWQSEDKAKADHDEMLAVAEQLDVLSANGGETVAWRCYERETGRPAIATNPDEKATYEKAGRRCVPLVELSHPAPVAVPEGWKGKVLELCSAVENDDDLPPVKYALKCGRLINEVKDMLTAAPSPDRSVEGGGADKCAKHGVALEWLPGRNAHPSNRYCPKCDGESPAQSVAEIKAEALEAYARDLRAVEKSAKRQNEFNTPAWYAGHFAKDADAAAARLRQSGNAGDDGEGGAV